MPINKIKTPNLAADLVAIFNIIEGLVVPTSFDTLINEKFQLKPTQDCDAMILHDFTDYQELGVVDLDDVTITFSYGYDTPCGFVYICTGIPFTPNSQYSLEGLEEDGCYVATVQIDYVVGLTTYTDTVNPAYQKDCCSSLFEELSEKIVSKMCSIVNTVCSYVKIGRNVDTMNESYLLLSNLYWLYCHSSEPCNDRDKVYCLFNKIK